MNCKEQVGTIFALFSCSVRKDPKGLGFSLSATASNQMLEIGTSADYGVCKGKRKDGMAYVKLLTVNITNRNLRTAFRNPPRSEGIYTVDPLSDRIDSKKSSKPVKLLSVEALKRALSNGDKVTTNRHYQGIRFLNAITEYGTYPHATIKESFFGKKEEETRKNQNRDLNEKSKQKKIQRNSPLDKDPTTIVSPERPYSSLEGFEISRFWNEMG
ncbi:Detected protein of confused Function [Hibiscus syriacus]|uniref:Detected protein of confused Function n=1 Tax=Hibiscus syriacus TaxID=106335 RepID=A0A6A3BQ72_HIBSY|nr:Detected protein of confused Function [Hibiscus syriacus]